MSLVSVSLFRYPPRHMLWALSRMQLALPGLARTPGLDFFKMMGSGGGNGFSIRPNLRVYALLSVWRDDAACDAFYADSVVLGGMRDRAEAMLTLRMRPFQAHGFWDGRTPFDPGLRALRPEPGQRVAVLTRARIKASKAAQFWRYVPAASAALGKHPDALLHIGVGEWPIFYQATLSVWKDIEAVKAYAYQDPAHAAVVRKTREVGWYAEEMFARFVVERMEGGL